MSMTDAQMDEALQTLGIKPADMVRVRLAPTYAKRKAALDAVQQQAKIGFRRAALRLHPDRTGGDAAKTEEYLRVQKVADTLLAMTPLPDDDARPVVGTLNINVTVRVAPPRRVL